MRFAKRKSLREDYARGIPDFVIVQIARDSSDSLRQHILRHIQQTNSNTEEYHRKVSAAAEVLTKLEVDMKEMLEEKLSDFLRST
jgi:hypothetical protein